MKVMKKKTASKIARGKLAKSQVFRGSKSKTSGGLTRGDLIKNKRGKIVSKKKSLIAAKLANKSGFTAWGKAVKKARESLNATGFVAINGKTALGKALYAKTKAIVSL